MAYLECRVEDMKMVSKYNMWVLRVVKARLDGKKMEKEKMFHHRGDGTFVVNGDVLDHTDIMLLWKEFKD